MTYQITPAIKCGNIDHGVYLFGDIKFRLNERLLDTSICNIKDITCDDHTWVKVHIEFTRDDYQLSLVEHQVSFIRGLVAGILIWSGVEVI